MNNKKYSIRNAVIITAIMTFLIMLPSMLQFNGVFIIRGDYLDQYLT